MTEPIGPGDWVEFIKPDEDALVTGALYLVEEIMARPCPCGANGFVRLAHMALPFSNWFYCSSGFRPIRPPKVQASQPPAKEPQSR